MMAAAAALMVFALRRSHLREIETEVAHGEAAPVPAV